MAVMDWSTARIETDLDPSRGMWMRWHAHVSVKHADTDGTRAIASTAQDFFGPTRRGVVSKAQDALEDWREREASRRLEPLRPSPMRRETR